MKIFLLFFSTLLACASLGQAVAAKTIPSAPRYFVSDEAQVLSDRSKQTLEHLLIEHERITSEQVLIAVFKSLEGEDLVDFTNRTFQAWKIGQRNKNNGVLVALFWDDHKARIDVGYGLEPLLTDARTKEIIENAMIPALKNGRADLALTQTALEILKTLESPLIANGKALEIVKSGGIDPTEMPRRTRAGGGLGLFSLFFFLLFIIRVLASIASPQAHYTRNGWYRPRPIIGFGGFGGLGGGGGFSGGGGSSGGGGASGSW